MYLSTQVSRPGGPGAMAMSVRGHSSGPDSLHLGDPFRTNTSDRCIHDILEWPSPKLVKRIGPAHPSVTEVRSIFGDKLVLKRLALSYSWCILASQRARHGDQIYISRPF